jgi:hypothetical protein
MCWTRKTLPQADFSVPLPGWIRYAQFIAVNRERLAPGNSLISTAVFIVAIVKR